MKRAVLIHGWGGLPDHGWFPWLQEKLEQAGWQVVNPLMPDTDTPTQEKWLAKLSEVIGEPDEETFLVGHSLGGITILRYLESLSEGKTIGGAILVAGFANDLAYDGYKGELGSFFTKPVDWDAINAHCPRFFTLYSKGDTWVDEANYHELKEKLHAQGELQDGSKHYSGDDGITELPIVLSVLEDMARR